MSTLAHAHTAVKLQQNPSSGILSDKKMTDKKIGQDECIGLSAVPIFLSVIFLSDRIRRDESALHPVIQTVKLRHSSQENSI
jgi:hypothetical protein